MWGQFLLSVFPGEEDWLCNCFTALKHAEKWSPMLISFPLGRVPNRFHIWVNYGQSRPHVNVTYIDFKLRLVFLPLHWLKLYFLFPLMIHAKISFLCITVIRRRYPLRIFIKKYYQFKNILAIKFRNEIYKSHVNLSSL